MPRVVASWDGPDQGEFFQKAFLGKFRELKERKGFESAHFSAGVMKTVVIRAYPSPPHFADGLADCTSRDLFSHPAGNFQQPKSYSTSAPAVVYEQSDYHPRDGGHSREGPHLSLEVF